MNPASWLIGVRSSPANPLPILCSSPCVLWTEPGSWPSYLLLPFPAIKWPASSNQFRKYWNSARQGRPFIRAQFPLHRVCSWRSVTLHNPSCYANSWGSIILCVLCLSSDTRYWVHALCLFLTIHPSAPSVRHLFVGMSLFTHCPAHAVTTGWGRAPLSVSLRITQTERWFQYPHIHPNRWMWPYLEHNGLWGYNLRFWGLELFQLIWVDPVWNDDVILRVMRGIDPQWWWCGYRLGSSGNLLEAGEGRGGGSTWYLTLVLWYSELWENLLLLFSAPKLTLAAFRSQLGLNQSKTSLYYLIPSGHFTPYLLVSWIILKWWFNHLFIEENC